MSNRDFIRCFSFTADTFVRNFGVTYVAGSACFGKIRTEQRSYPGAWPLSVVQVKATKKMDTAQ